MMERRRLVLCPSPTGATTVMPSHRDKKGKEFGYVTTIGRVTGQPREIEIWFTEADGRLFIISGEPKTSNWVKNIRKDSHVRVWLAGKEFSATARLLDPNKDDASYDLARRLSLEKYDWDDGLPVEITPD